MVINLIFCLNILTKLGIILQSTCPCGTCLKVCGKIESDVCIISTLADLLQMI